MSEKEFLLAKYGIIATVLVLTILIVGSCTQFVYNPSAMSNIVASCKSSYMSSYAENRSEVQRLRFVLAQQCNEKLFEEK